jgi:hypothetical protein
VIKDYKKGIHSFLSLQEKTVYLSTKNPGEYNEVAISDKHLILCTIAGEKKVSSHFHFKILT